MDSPEPPPTIRGLLPDHRDTPLDRVPEEDRCAVLARAGSARETPSAFQSSGSVRPAP
ncbi:FXSXX-COOH protein [Streptomyces sp. NPDC001985]|uniref:FXSXX-COOH protein n=1 Tax=Streptomyces sp. NPDC001985 TaxID=3154406 RepID=UPI003319685D